VGHDAKSRTKDSKSSNWACMCESRHMQCQSAKWNPVCRILKSPCPLGIANSSHAPEFTKDLLPMMDRHSTGLHWWGRKHCLHHNHVSHQFFVWSFHQLSNKEKNIVIICCWLLHDIRIFKQIADLKMVPLIHIFDSKWLCPW
jgi:hypothetical protein